MVSFSHKYHGVPKKDYNHSMVWVADGKGAYMVKLGVLNKTTLKIVH
jgi:hypothetical protein